MKKLIVAIVILLIVSSTSPVNAQWESIRQEGEIGFSLGAAHYFGDLNTRGKVNRPKPVIGVFFRKQFGNYVGLRVGAHFAQLGYSDIYNTKNEFNAGAT